MFRCRGGRRSDHVDVDRDEHTLCSIGGVGDGVIDDGGESAPTISPYEKGAHAPLPHPGNGRGFRPISAKTDLHEPMPGNCSRFDESAHRGAVTVHHSPLALSGVGVRIEVDQRDLAVTVDVGDTPASG